MFVRALLRSVCCALLLAPFGVAAAAEASGSQDLPASSERQLQAIERQLAVLEHEYRRLQESRVSGDPARATQAGEALIELRRLRERLESWLARRDREPYRRNLDRFLRDLEGRLGRLDVALLQPRGGRAGIYDEQPAAKTAKRGPGRQVASPAGEENLVPTNDDCALAAIVGDGTVSGSTHEATVDGESTCGASVVGPDVWFRYVASEAGEVAFNTFGAAFDTVLSLHAGCPGTTANELGCNDDAVGVQSELVRVMTEGEEVLVRVGGFAGDYGAFLLNIDQPAVLAGVVTDAVTGQGLSRASITIYDQNGSWEESTSSSASGTYAVTGLRAGVHFAKASEYLYQTQLYDGIDCPGSCDPTLGTPILLALGETVQADFALHPGSKIEGRVTSEATGGPLGGVRVRAYDQGGEFQGSDWSNSSGDYEIRGLVAGTHFAVAESDSGHLGELFDDVPCPVDCLPTTGTPIVLGVDDSARADFTLPLGGSISGHVTVALTGQPLEGAYVVVQDDQGGWVDSESAGASGYFSVGGLATGSYRASASQYGYLGQLFDGLECEPGCDPLPGTPIAVTTGVETSGIDFAMVREAAFSGLVVDAAVGVSIEDVSVQAWDGGGNWIGSEYSETWGNYVIGGLTAGTYFATTENYSGYLDELYDDLPCPQGVCSPLTGTPIAVATSVNTTGIDFALDPGGSISGGVTDVAYGADLSGRMRIWDAGGSLVDDPYLEDGRYWLGGLTTGTYFVTTDIYGNWADELYEDLPCQPSCDVTTGTPVAVSQGIDTSGVDFALCGPPKVLPFFPPSHDPDSFVDGCRVQIDGTAAAYHPSCQPVDRVHWSWDDGKENDSPFPAAHMYQPGNEWVTVSVEAFDTQGLGSLAVEKQLHLWDCLEPGVCGYPESRELFNLSLDSTHLIQACTDIAVGPGFHLLDPADVTIRAGGSVVLRSGTHIESGRLTIENDPALLPPP